MTSFTFRNSRGGGGPTDVIQGGGGGVKLFTKGVESNCCAIELVICTGLLDPPNYHEF